MGHSVTGTQKINSLARKGCRRTCRPEAVRAAAARGRTEPGEAASWPPTGANLRLTALPERSCSLGVLDVDLRDGVALPALRPAGGTAPPSRGVPVPAALEASGLQHPLEIIVKIKDCVLLM